MSMCVSITLSLILCSYAPLDLVTIMKFKTIKTKISTHENYLLYSTMEPIGQNLQVTLQVTKLRTYMQLPPIDRKVAIKLNYVHVHE